MRQALAYMYILRYDENDERKSSICRSWTSSFRDINKYLKGRARERASNRILMVSQRYLKFFFWFLRSRRKNRDDDRNLFDENKFLFSTTNKKQITSKNVQPQARACMYVSRNRRTYVRVCVVCVRSRLCFLVINNNRY